MADLQAFADKLERLPDELKKTINSGEVAIGDVIVQVAKQSHKFTNRTGRLESSIKSRKSGTGVEAYLDTGTAPYAGYIHNGTKYIEADPFLANAADSRQVDAVIDAVIERALEVALNRI